MIKKIKDALKGVVADCLETDDEGNHYREMY